MEVTKREWFWCLESIVICLCAHVCRFISSLLDAVQISTESDANELSLFPMNGEMRICTTHPGTTSIVYGISIKPADYQQLSTANNTWTSRAIRLSRGANFTYMKRKKSHFIFAHKLYERRTLFSPLSLISTHSLGSLSAPFSQRIFFFIQRNRSHTYTKERRSSWRRHFGPADFQICPTLWHFLSLSG